MVHFANFRIDVLLVAEFVCVLGGGVGAGGVSWVSVSSCDVSGLGVIK